MREILLFPADDKVDVCEYVCSEHKGADNNKRVQSTQLYAKEKEKSVMATQIIARQTTQTKSPEVFEKVMNFLSSVAELFHLYFNSPMRLDTLDEEFRTRLTAHERAVIDRDLLGIGPY